MPGQSRKTSSAVGCATDSGCTGTLLVSAGDEARASMTSLLGGAFPTATR